MCRNLTLTVFVVTALLTRAFEVRVAAASAGVQVSPQVGKHKMLEVAFTSSLEPANPFDTYLLKIEVTDPADSRFNVEGFYDGDGKGSVFVNPVFGKLLQHRFPLGNVLSINPQGLAGADQTL